MHSLIFQYFIRNKLNQLGLDNKWNSFLVRNFGSEQRTGDLTIAQRGLAYSKEIGLVVLTFAKSWCPSLRTIKICGVIAGGTVTVALIGYFCIRERLRGYWTKGPYHVAESRTIPRVLQRMLIDKTRVNLKRVWHPLNALATRQPKRPNENGHKIAGAVRDAARQLIHTAVNAVGGSVFEVSAARQSNARDGLHQHYAVGDLDRGVRNGVPTPDAIVVGIDIDYYIEDLSVVLGDGNPAIFHTFNPITVSGTDGDCAFRISDNRVIYEVGGGGCWEHPVWDWCGFGEFMRVPAKRRRLFEKLLNIFGIQKNYYYKICHARPWRECENRALVWLMPEASAWQFTCFASDLQAREMTYVKYSDDTRPGWNKIVHLEGRTKEVSVGRAGEDAHMEIDKDAFDVLMGLSTTQSISSRMIQMQLRDPQDLALMCQYFKGSLSLQDNSTRIGQSMRPEVYWPPSMDTDVPETSARVYSSPIVGSPNLIPMIKRLENMSNSLETRVSYVANSVVPSKRYEGYADEFVNLLVPESSIGVPYDLETTAAMLDKPSQALAIKNVWETVDMEPRQLIEAFVKNEPTNKAGRIISSFPDMRYLLNFSTYTLAFRDQVLHARENRHWFCPGLTPNQISVKVQEYVGQIDTPVEGDFSNFDGTVSKWCQRNVMNAVYLRYFRKEYVASLQACTDRLISCPARAKNFNFKYEAGVGVKSGSPTTCDLNTVLNAFIQYCAIRRTSPDLSTSDAYRLIGLAFGDDSLFSSEYSVMFKSVAEDLGMELKVLPYDATEGLTFLARVFPDPYVTTTSFQDPLRTMRKLHMTTRDPNIPIADAALDRVEGYLVTDSLSPVVGSYCRMVKRMYRDASSLEVRSKRKSHQKEKPYWLTTGGAWPQREEDVPLMFEVAAKRLGMDVEQLRVADAHFNECKSLWFAPICEPDETPYKGTVGADGGMAEANVDLRLVDNERQKVVERTLGVLAGKGKRPDHGNKRPDQPRDGQWKRPKGPGRIQNRDDRCGGKGGNRNPESSGKADRDGVVGKKRRVRRSLRSDRDAGGIGATQTATEQSPGGSANSPV